jgi:Tol biopolymer transport system component
MLLGFLFMSALACGTPKQSASSALEQNQATPREFAPGVVSTGHEFGISFTPDGKEAYFSRFAAKQPIHIFRTRFVHGSWQEAEKLSLSSEDWSDLDPFVSPDGQKLFFVSTRPADRSAEPRGNKNKNMDIWVAVRTGTEWSTPLRVENVNSNSKEGSPCVAQGGTLYFFSDRQGGADKNAIYESRYVGGHYQMPVRLPSTINVGPSDTSPFISPDGKTLLFYSTRPGGMGKADLYVSSRRHGNWTMSTNLGPIVNSAESEYNPSVSPDGRQLFFGRNSRIYVVAATAIPDLKPELFHRSK